MLRGMVFIDHMNFDIAFFLSADTDYIKVYEVLKSIGKITVVVGVKGQNINSIRSMVDNTLVLDEVFLKHAREDHIRNLQNRIEKRKNEFYEFNRRTSNKRSK